MKLSFFEIIIKPFVINYKVWFCKIRQDSITKKYIKKITNSSKIHEFFYEQSNYKVGASENNLQIDIAENREELFNNYYFENNSANMIHYQIKNFFSLKEEPKRKLNLISKRK